MVETYSITPAEPAPYIPTDVTDFANHLEQYGNIPEIDVFQCHEAIHTVSLDVAERIFRPNTDARTLIGEYFTAQEVGLEPQQPAEPINPPVKQQVTTHVVKGWHKGVLTNYLVTSTPVSDALQLQ